MQKPNVPDPRYEEAAKRLALTAERKSGNQMDLFLPVDEWSDVQRGIPNGFLRSAIFSVAQRAKPEQLTRAEIASVEGIEIRYTGAKLNQDHLTLWGNLVHVVRTEKLGNRCETTTYKLLKMQNRSDTGSTREALYKQLAELQATAVEIKQGRYTYSGSFIVEAFRDEEINRLIVILNPRIIELFAPNHYTRVSWLIRLELKTQVARWLHGFYSSHREPYDYKLTTIQQLCGSVAKDMSNFKTHSLIPALNEIAEASEKHGQAFNFEIVNGKLKVNRKRHL